LSATAFRITGVKEGAISASGTRSVGSVGSHPVDLRKKIAENNTEEACPGDVLPERGAGGCIWKQPEAMKKNFC